MASTRKHDTRAGTGLRGKQMQGMHTQKGYSETMVQEMALDVSLLLSLVLTATTSPKIK